MESDVLKLEVLSHMALPRLNSTNSAKKKIFGIRGNALLIKSCGTIGFKNKELSELDVEAAFPISLQLDCPPTKAVINGN